VLVLAAIVLFAATAHADTHKFAIVIGNNRGHDPAETLRYAEQDARKMHAVLTELGGFRKRDTLLLTAADADRVREVIRRTEGRIRKRKRDSGGKALLLLFYSGHAEGEVLELAPPRPTCGWPSSIPARAARSSA
jgi:hypothetical protein